MRDPGEDVWKHGERAKETWILKRPEINQQEIGPEVEVLAALGRWERGCDVMATHTGTRF